MSGTLRPTPQIAARELSAERIARGYRPDGLFEYQDVEGVALFWRIRLKHPATGEKWIRPMVWDRSKFRIGEPKFSSNGKPLYRLPELVAAEAGTRILIVEGEPKVDALLERGMIATTSGGSSSADAADWSPLEGRCCLIWPDHDAAGSAYATSVESRLRTLGCEVSIIDVAKLNLPAKGDAIDWLRDHPDATAADILALPLLVQRSHECEGPIVKLTRADQVECRPIDWLWPGWMARGKLHILAGAPGTGKTTIALALAAVVTRGSRWPDGTSSSPGNVLLWSGEDSASDTLVPRLRAAGADLARVLIVGDVSESGGSRPFDPSVDMSVLEDEARKFGGIALLIADPVVSAIAGDSHKNTEVRRALQPLVNLAEQTGAAVLGITHFSKGSAGRDPLDRVTGSVAFGAVARVVMVAAKRSAEKGDGADRLLARAKSNVGPDGGGFGYTLEQASIQTHCGTMDASLVRWGDAQIGSALDLLNIAEEGRGAIRSESRSAIAWLTDALEQGPRASRDIRDAAERDGFAWRTVQRAAHAVGVVSETRGYGQDRSATWSLPNCAKERPFAPSVPSRISGANGANGVDPWESLQA